MSWGALDIAAWAQQHGARGLTIGHRVRWASKGRNMGTKKDPVLRAVGGQDGDPFVSIPNGAMYQVRGQAAIAAAQLGIPFSDDILSPGWRLPEEATLPLRGRVRHHAPLALAAPPFRVVAGSFQGAPQLTFKAVTLTFFPDLVADGQGVLFRYDEVYDIAWGHERPYAHRLVVVVTMQRGEVGFGGYYLLEEEGRWLVELLRAVVIHGVEAAMARVQLLRVPPSDALVEEDVLTFVVEGHKPPPLVAVGLVLVFVVPVLMGILVPILKLPELMVVGAITIPIGTVVALVGTLQRPRVEGGRVRLGPDGFRIDFEEGQVQHIPLDRVLGVAVAPPKHASLGMLGPPRTDRYTGDGAEVQPGYPGAAKQEHLLVLHREGHLDIGVVGGRALSLREELERHLARLRA